MRGYDIGSSKGFWVARERPPFWSEPPASGFIQTLPGLNSRVPDRLRVCSAVVSTTFTIMICPFFSFPVDYGFVFVLFVLKISLFYKRKFQWHFS